MNLHALTWGQRRISRDAAKVPHSGPVARDEPCYDGCHDRTGMFKSTIVVETW
jgi:hypothetical protein